MVKTADRSADAARRSAGDAAALLPSKKIFFSSDMTYAA
jgi:hypothetical protein